MIKCEQLFRINEILEDQIKLATGTTKEILNTGYTYTKASIDTVEKAVKVIIDNYKFLGIEANENKILNKINQDIETLTESNIPNDTKAIVYKNGIEFIINKASYSFCQPIDFIAEYKGSEALNIWWWYQFNKLDEYKKELIRLIANKELTTDKTKLHLQDGNWITPDKLYLLCVHELKNNDLLKDCNRCEGSGHYSKNAQGQTYCYKCHGYGKELPNRKSYTKKFIKQIMDKKVVL